MFNNKKQSVDSNSNATFLVSVVKSKDRKVLQKGTLEVTPSSVMYRGNEGSKTKLSWSLKSLRKIEATTDRMFMMDTGDTSCSLSEEGVIWFFMHNAKQVQNVILWNMNIMIQSETPSNHRSVTNTTSLPMNQTSAVHNDDYSPPVPPMHWRLNTRASVDSNSSTVSPTSSRASSVQRDIYEVERVFDSGRRERGVIEVLENEVIFVESETGERRRISWAFKYIRRFGHEGDIFTIEVGRRAPGGQGLHNFKTPNPAELNAAVKSASVSGRRTPPSPHTGENSSRSQARTSFTPPSQRHSNFNPQPQTSYPPPMRAAPLPPTPSQHPPLPVPPSPPRSARNSAHFTHHHSQLPPPPNNPSSNSRAAGGGGFSRSDSLLRRAFSAAELRQNVFEVKNISDDKKEVGQGTLEVTLTDLVYVDSRTKEKWRWPFKFLRKYGYEKEIFSFEAGRRCPGGQGLYAFSSDRASEIHEMIVSNIQGKKQKEDKDQKKSQASSSNAAEARTQRGMLKSQSRYSFNEEQQSPSLVKLTTKNHYNIDTSLHALMQTRPLPAEPQEEVPPPPTYPAPLPTYPAPLPTYPAPLPTYPAPPPTYPAPPPTHSTSPPTRSIPPPTHTVPPPKALGMSAQVPKMKSPSPPPSAVANPPSAPQVPPPMKLVKPVLPPVKQQPLIREHHYDVPEKYGANLKDSKKMKRVSSSDAKGKKGVSASSSKASVPSTNGSVSSKKRSSKPNIAENLVPPQGAESSKESKSKFFSLLTKKKKKRASIDFLTNSPLPNSNAAATRSTPETGTDEPRGMYVNVKLGSLQRMKKSISCDDILNSCEMADANTESCVPLPQLFASHTPPAQRRQTNEEHSPIEVAQVYQNLQDIKAKDEHNPVANHPTEDCGTPPKAANHRSLYTNFEIINPTTEDRSSPPTAGEHSPLYTNFEIMPEPEAQPAQKVIAYTEVDIRQTSPPRVGPSVPSPLETRFNGNHSMSGNGLPPLLKQAILKGGPKKSTPKPTRDRSQSLFPAQTHEEATEVKTEEVRQRSQSETAPKEDSMSAVVMDAVQELDNSQRFERVQYAPLDFIVMDAVAEIKKGHQDIRNFDELLERHDIREMEAEGRKR